MADEDSDSEPSRQLTGTKIQRAERKIAKTIEQLETLNGSVSTSKFRLDQSVELKHPLRPGAKRRNIALECVHSVVQYYRTLYQQRLHYWKGLKRQDPLLDVLPADDGQPSTSAECHSMMKHCHLEQGSSGTDDLNQNDTNTRSSPGSGCSEWSASSPGGRATAVHSHSEASLCSDSSCDESDGDDCSSSSDTSDEDSVKKRSGFVTLMQDNKIRISLLPRQRKPVKVRSAYRNGDELDYVPVNNDSMCSCMAEGPAYDGGASSGSATDIDGSEEFPTPVKKMKVARH